MFMLIGLGVFVLANFIIVSKYEHEIKRAERSNKKMSNKQWIDLLSEQFNVSRTTAKEMLHVMMKIKKEDNFKKQFSGRSMKWIFYGRYDLSIRKIYKNIRKYHLCEYFLKNKQEDK